LWNQLQKFGHIVILPQYIDPDILGDTSILAASRYVGIMLRKVVERETITLSGAGMVWWLGDPNEISQLIEIEVELESSTLENALDQLLPDSIIKGTIVEPAGQTYSGTHQYESPLEAIRTVCASLGAEFRVNNDGTIDAGPKEDIFIGIPDPEVVITGEIGKDASYLALDADEMKMSEDASPYASRVIVVTEDSDNVETLVGYIDRSPAPTELDLHGNAVARTFMVNTFGSPVSVATYTLSVLNDHAVVAQIDISTQFQEMAEGSFNVGDGFYAYRPPAFVDLSNEIAFRGEIINPKELRLLSASWGVREGMGVFYRTPTDPPEYIDITRWVMWEGSGIVGGV
jgi:hypothetical protein